MHRYTAEFLVSVPGNLIVVQGLNESKPTKNGAVFVSTEPLRFQAKIDDFDVQIAEGMDPDPASISSEDRQRFGDDDVVRLLKHLCVSVSRNEPSILPKVGR